MPATVTSGPSLVLDNFETHLADCTTFRTLTGATTQAEAKARIWQDHTPAPDNGEEYTLAELETMRPFALIWLDEGGTGYERTVIDAGFGVMENGVIMLRLEEDVPSNLDGSPGEAMRRWRDTWGNILSDLEGLAGDNPYISIRKSSMLLNQRNHQDQNPAIGDTHIAEIRIEFGP